MATSLINLVTEADLIGFGKDGTVGSLTWSVASLTGNGGNNVYSNLGPLAGAKVIILPSASGKAVVLGGVTNGQGMSFGNLPIVDMTSGAVVIQKTQASTLLGGIPSQRYGHCVALSTDGNTIYMFGGSLVASNKTTNDLYALDLRTWTWSQPTIKSSTVVPPPVRDHQCVMIGDQFLSLLGFNSNQAPASLNPLNSSSSSSIPSPPPIYVLSTSQLTWSTVYTPLPGTPSPPTPPNVPTDGNKGKVSGAGIAFGVIFGLAFVGVIGYLVISHKRKQQRKAETLLLVEMEQQKKEEAKLDKERQQRLEQQKDADLPPLPPPTAYNGNYHNMDGYGGYTGNYNNNNNNNNNNINSGNNYNNNDNNNNNSGRAAHYPPVGSAEPSTAYYYNAQRDPFQNPSYLHNQNTASQMAPNHHQYYPQAGAFSSTGGGGGGGGGGARPDRNPFGQHPPVPSTFVPEEMGYTPPTHSGNGHVRQESYSYNYKEPVEPASSYL
ncbi:hypothetical protein BGZ58_008866 [Dissophora ornata]|nr:hypothetical protein BGZ58_008866 [Dissophora ornata]